MNDAGEGNEEDGAGERDENEKTEKASSKKKKQSSIELEQYSPDELRATNETALKAYIAELEGEFKSFFFWAIETKLIFGNLQMTLRVPDRTSTSLPSTANEKPSFWTEQETSKRLRMLEMQPRRGTMS